MDFKPSTKFHFVMDAVGETISRAILLWGDESESNQLIQYKKVPWRVDR